MNPRNENEAFTAMQPEEPRRGYASMPRYHAPMLTEARMAWALVVVFAAIALAGFVFGWAVVR